jgi:hypothetical protein
MRFLTILALLLILAGAAACATVPAPRPYPDSGESLVQGGSLTGEAKIYFPLVLPHRAQSPAPKPQE